MTRPGTGIGSAFSAVLEDMSERGLLDETLLVAKGEFGRLSKSCQRTSSAGATSEGRDHWPHCYTILMASDGIQGDYVHGAPDKLVPCRHEPR